jgi:hypothetical protein
MMAVMLGGPATFASRFFYDEPVVEAVSDGTTAKAFIACAAMLQRHSLR